MKRLLLLLAAIAALEGATAALAARNIVATARLVSVTSPVARNARARLVAHVVPSERCTIAVFYATGRSRARGLDPKRPVRGRVSWTWTVAANTALGRWPIQVKCGSAGSFRTHFTVVR